MATLRARANAYVGGLQLGQRTASVVTVSKDSSGWAQISQALSGIGVNEARHSSQIGTRFARTSNFSQIRQGAGKKTLASASCASLKKLLAIRRKGRRRSTPFANGQDYSVDWLRGSAKLANDAVTA